jgi:septum formation protein
MVTEFEVHAVDIEELAPSRLPVPDALEVIARKKALAASRFHRDDWILGADTVAHYRGEVLGKARTPSEARMRLAILSGTTHEVSTGVALVQNERVIDAVSATTKVTMDLLPRHVLDDYVASEEWRGKAGAYGIQDTALSPYITIEGSWSNVVGLPMAATVGLLQEYDIPCKPAPEEAWLRDHNPFQNAA